VIHLSNKEDSKIIGRRLRPRAYLAGEGLHLEVSYHDSNIEKPDNKFDLWFQLGEAALVVLAGRAVEDQADAKTIARVNETRVRNAIAKWIQERGLSSPGGGPRVLLATDLH